MSFGLGEIKAVLSKHKLLVEIAREQDGRFKKMSAVETCSADDLVCVDKKEYLPLLRERRPRAVVTSRALAAEVVGADGVVGSGSKAIFNIVVVTNVALAHAFLKQELSGRDYGRSGWSGIHPTAVVHESAHVHPTATVEPRAVIGMGTVDGAHSRIMAGVVIESDVVIGENCLIHPNAVVGYGCKLGNFVEIEAGTVIGSEGFGFAQDVRSEVRSEVRPNGGSPPKRRSYAIPQTGIVVLEDHVRLGSNCSVDRATYQETRIGAGTKIDNLCHIAHNVKIGEDCLLTAMLCVAGSTQIGDRVITSGQTGILDHMTVCSDTVLLHRAGVTKDVDRPGAYAGLPLQPLAEYLKNTAVLRNATELRKRISDLEKAGQAGTQC